MTEKQAIEAVRDAFAQNGEAGIDIAHDIYKSHYISLRDWNQARREGLAMFREDTNAPTE